MFGRLIKRLVDRNSYSAIDMHRIAAKTIQIGVIFNFTQTEMSVL